MFHVPLTCSSSTVQWQPRTHPQPHIPTNVYTLTHLTHNPPTLTSPTDWQDHFLLLACKMSLKRQVGLPQPKLREWLAIQKTVNLNLKRQVGSVDRSCVNDLPSRIQLHIYTQSPCPTTITSQHKFPQLAFPITNTHHPIPRLLPYNHNNQITRLFPTINKKLYLPHLLPHHNKNWIKNLFTLYFFSHARSQIQQHIFETQIYQLLFTNSRFTTTTSPW